MTKNFIDDNRFREKDNAAKLIEIMNSFDGVTNTTVYYNVDYNPYRRQAIFRLAMVVVLAACIARMLARKRG